MTGNTIGTSKFGEACVPEAETPELPWSGNEVREM